MIIPVIKDFTPEPFRIYSVRAVAYGKRNKVSAIKIFPLMVYVKEKENFFIARTRVRCENQKPKISSINRIEIFFLRKAGFIHK